MSPAWTVPGLYLLGYALLHSLLAARPVKRRAARLLGPRMAYYRLGYVFLSVLLLLPLPFLPMPPGRLYCVPVPWDWVLRGLQAASLAGFLWALGAVDQGEFLGLAQIRRHRAGLPSLDLDETPELVTRGPYRFCRHPLYLFASCGLLAQPCVTRAYALLAGWTLLYFWTGSHFEERRLIRQFGDAYLRYRAATPRLFPFPRRPGRP